MLGQDCGCGNVCDELAPSRIYKFLCASGASPRLRRRLPSGAPRPRALRAPPPFPFSPTRKNCLFFSHREVEEEGNPSAHAQQRSSYIPMYDPNVQMAQPVMAQPQPMLMSVQVPQGMMGGMMIQVQTPAGLMQVQIPQGLYPGQTFQMQVPMPARQPQMMMQQQQMMQQPQMQMMMPPPPPPQVVIQQQPQVIVQQPATTVIHPGGGYYGGGGGYYGGDGGLGVGLAGGLIGGMMLGAALDGGDGGWGGDGGGWGGDCGGWD